ncbi:LysR family transcriptional regulator [Amycolatopsis rhabdoformis]|uniref:LysR family transcriptional regulator n=1 Tax=Amycolatopsis rhabdoformis TaxID=1448059 RepID=A0ABZ1IFG0_9PSEU|nr:LysR family transcriptional regulator [Amycolatopsis rhabdoformis]WSE32486.1 LysR family transcriptional regulator [Amycolatopsis rhabdoformis]
MKATTVTLRQLEYFVATVELGTLSAAAAHFHISQTAVSLAITQLEKALDVQVLVRRPAKPPTPTAAGRQLLTDARRVLSDAGELESAVRTVGQEVSGRLAVGCFPTITPFVMGRLLEALQERHPDLSIDLVEDSVRGLQRKLTEGACDVAIMYDIGLEPGITTVPLYSCPPYAVLPADHPLAHHTSVRAADLIHEPLIMIDLPPSADFFADLLTRAGHTPDIRFRTRSVETVRALVGRGRGWAILLHRPAVPHSYDGREVAAVPLSDVGAPIDVLLARATHSRPTRRALAFSHLCREVLTSDQA